MCMSSLLCYRPFRVDKDDDIIVFSGLHLTESLKLNLSTFDILQDVKKIMCYSSEAQKNLRFKPFLQKINLINFV